MRRRFAARPQAWSSVVPMAAAREDEVPMRRQRSAALTCGLVARRFRRSWPRYSPSPIGRQNRRQSRNSCATPGHEESAPILFQGARLCSHTKCAAERVPRLDTGTRFSTHSVVPICIIQTKPLPAASYAFAGIFADLRAFTLSSHAADHTVRRIMPVMVQPGPHIDENSC